MKELFHKKKVLGKTFLQSADLQVGFPYLNGCSWCVFVSWCILCTLKTYKHPVNVSFACSALVKTTEKLTFCPVGTV